MARTVIDPVTRVGGQLRIEVEIANGAVTDAWSEGTMFRGIEQVLRGRDPRDAWLFAQRICGTCAGVHALASVRAVEDALDLRVPRNARLLRNLLAGTTLVVDHVVSFYHRHALDWVDVLAALKADPAATSALAHRTSAWTNASPAYFAGVRDKLAALVASGQLGLFANGYWGHPAYQLAPEADLLILAHYLEALGWQTQVMQIHTLVGGKSPHPQTYLVGGMAVAPTWGGPSSAGLGEHPQVDVKSPAAISERGLASIEILLGEAKEFVDKVYLPDVLLLPDPYREWSTIGRGIGSFLAAGDLPEDDTDAPALFFARGRVSGGDLATPGQVDPAAIAEDITHAHYTDETGATARPPWDDPVAPRYGGPRPPVTTFEGVDRYSWLKAPRYAQEPMEVGPLARMLVGYVQGHADVRTALDASASGAHVGVDGLVSTLGRTIARAVETQVVAARLGGWLGELRANLATGDLAFADVSRWNPASWPADPSGFSLGEAPRGTVGHWVGIRDHRISRYAVVDATTWNGSPRDAQGRRGPLEQALIGTPVADRTRPLEILRTVHSFDPCAGCAVHAHRPGGGGPIEIRVV